MTRVSPLWLAAVALVFLSDLFLHLPITDLCDVIAARLGLWLYDRSAAVGFAALGLAAPIVIARWRAPAARFLAVPTAVLVGVALIVQKTLLVASIENIHYPQYALLTVLLGQSGLGPEVSWLVATALGFVDEGYQWKFMPRGTFKYFDWNDVFLNAVGAAFGVIVLRLLRTGEDAPVVPGRVVAGLLALGWVAALLVAPPRAPFYSVTPTGIRYHVLSAFEGALLLGLVWLAIRYIVRRSARPR